LSELEKYLNELTDQNEEFEFWDAIFKHAVTYKNDELILYTGNKVADVIERPF